MHVAMSLQNSCLTISRTTRPILDCLPPSSTDDTHNCDNIGVIVLVPRDAERICIANIAVSRIAVRVDAG